MKVLRTLILFATGVIGAQSFKITLTDADKQLSLQNLATLFADAIVANLLPLVDVSKYETKEEGSLFLPIIRKGNLSEAIPFFDFNLLIPSNDLVTGRYGHSGTAFKGLDTFEMGAYVKFVVPIKITVSSSADEFAIRGTSYDMDLNFNMRTLIGLLFPDFPELANYFPPTLNVAGTGDYELVALKPYFRMVVDFAIRGDKPYVRTESVTLGFEGVNATFNGLKMGGLDFDWGVINFEDVNNLIMQLIHALEPLLPAGFDFVFQFLIANCPIADLLKGDLSCLGIGIIPAREAAAFGLGSSVYSSSVVVFTACLPVLLMSSAK